MGPAPGEPEDPLQQRGHRGGQLPSLLRPRVRAPALRGRSRHKVGLIILSVEDAEYFLALDPVYMCGSYGAGAVKLTISFENTKVFPSDQLIFKFT